MFKKKMNLTPLLKSLLKLSLCAVSAEFFCVVYNAGLTNNISSGIPDSTQQCLSRDAVQRALLKSVVHPLH